MMYCVDDLGVYLEGSWSLSRQIYQGSAGEQALERRGKMKGRVLVSRTHRGLSYHEEGRLEYEERPFGQADYQGFFEQVYSLVLKQESPQHAQILFSDERPFFILDLSKGECSLEHVCGDDRYLATFSAFERSLSCEWHVKGSCKNYVLKTVLRKNST